MKKIGYFVSFAFVGKRGHDQGFGCTESWRTTPVSSFKEIEAMAEEIRREYDHQGVIILSWQRFEQQAEV